MVDFFTLSSEHDARILFSPTIFQSTLVTASMCPVSVVTLPHVTVSHTLTDWSSEAVARWASFGPQQRLQTSALESNNDNNDNTTCQFFHSFRHFLPLHSLSLPSFLTCCFFLLSPPPPSLPPSPLPLTGVPAVQTVGLPSQAEVGGQRRQQQGRLPLSPAQGRRHPLCLESY